MSQKLTFAFIASLGLTVSGYEAVLGVLRRDDVVPLTDERAEGLTNLGGIVNEQDLVAQGGEPPGLRERGPLVDTPAPAALHSRQNAGQV